VTGRDSWQARHAARPERPAPSPFVAELAAGVARSAPGARALDLACGSGRHAALLASHGFRTFALDVASAACRRVAAEIAGVHAVVADASALPFAPRTFDVVVQTLFLDRTVLPRLVELLAPGGVLIAETFLRAQHDATGHPRLEFCLAPGELVQLCTSSVVPVQVLAVREGPVERNGDAVHLASVAVRRTA
jgi:SAM-dependent methyltransferase